MELKNYFAQDSQGNALPGANYYVYLPGTTTITTIYDADGVAIANPGVSDSNGLIQFAAPNGRYDLRVVLGSRDYTIEIQCNDALSTIDRLNVLEQFDADLANATDPAKGAGMVGFLGGDIYAALMARKCLPVEVLAAKYDLPLTNVGAIINSAWTDGIGVALGPQVYTNSTTMLLRNGALLIGHGSGVSGIKSANGFAGNMIDTANFAALQAAQPVSVNDPTNPVPHGFVLSGFFLDGNALNYSGAVSATNGFGIRIYGRGYTVRDVRLNRIPGVGFYSELAASGTYYNSDPAESKPFSPLDEYGGIGIQGLYIYDTGEEGFVFAGPADIQVNDLYVGWPADSYRNGTYNASKTSKLFPGRTVDAALFLRSCEVGFVHAFDNRNGYGIYVDRLAAGQPAVRFNAAYVMGENCFGNIYFGPNMRYQIGILDSHNNTGGDGSRPHLDIQASFGGVCDNVKVKKEASYLSEYACDVARLTGAKQKLKIFIETTAGQTAGRGVLCSCPISDIEVLGSALSGAPQSGGTSSYLAEVTSSFTSSRLKVIGQLCDGAVNFASSPSGDYNSMFQIVSDRCTNVANGIASLQRRQTADIDISHIPSAGSTPQRNQGTFATSVNLSSSLEQTLVIGHFLVAAPQINNCRAYIVNPSGSMPNMEYAVVSSVDASNITVKIKFSGGGTGTATLMVDAAI